MNLLPQVKKIILKEGFLQNKCIIPFKEKIDHRLITALEKLPVGQRGVKIFFDIGNAETEKYSLDINEDKILVSADGVKGAFYAIQTLRQIFSHDEIPCLYIEDEPDFSYRGLYHDVTRGKIPKIQTIKKLIDDMAYYKMNSLQLYVEHTFEFKETAELVTKTGCLTKEEIIEIDEYCNDNFIEFIPSIATFGHMYEILEQDKYKHLRVLKEYIPKPNFWEARMIHHTIDPLNEESIKLITSLIDQYYPLFKTEWFNICGDETFDLNKSLQNADVGKLYTGFVKEIINHLHKNNKKIMMWADILLNHPETINELPEDICFLNWCYDSEPSEESIIEFAKCGRKQIVCPGTSSWSRFCENTDIAEQNISNMVEYGYKHGAIGVLNTNWGDWGNPASIELAMYSIVFCAAKSWSVSTDINEEFCKSVNKLLYGAENALESIKRISKVHDLVKWNDFCSHYFEYRFENNTDAFHVNVDDVVSVQKEYISLKKKLTEEVWDNEETKQELIICIEGICVLAELSAKMAGLKIDRLTDTQRWLNIYKKKWFDKNKVSELSKIEEMFLYLENIKAY